MLYIDIINFDTCIYLYILISMLKCKIFSSKFYNNLLTLTFIDETAAMTITVVMLTNQNPGG